MIGLVIMLICCWGCAALFLGIGLWADRRTTPMNFWAGTQIPEQCVSDIPSYNRANARLWMAYSVPFWLAGVCAFFSDILAGGILILACFPGLPVLIRGYRGIEKKYVKALDKSGKVC